MTTVKIVELLSAWGKRFSAGYAEASRSLLVFWIGLTPKDHSTAGNFRLGVITRDGDERLPSVLVVGATAVIQHALGGGKASPWRLELLKRKSPKLATGALANKTERTASSPASKHGDVIPPHDGSRWTLTRVKVAEDPASIECATGFSSPLSLAATGSMIAARK